MVMLPPEFIKEIDVIKKFKGLFNEFTGLDLEIFHVDGVPIQFPCSARKQNKSCYYKTRPVNCNQIKHEVLREVSSSGKTHNFLCPAGRTKLIVPLPVNGDTTDILFVGENNVSKLDKKRVGALSKLLGQVTSYIIQNETASLKYFKGTSFTHQQQMLQRVVKYIHNNAQNNHLSLRKVAQDNAVSYHYLSHLFRKELKTTFVEFYRKVKMDLAIKLLKNFGLNVNQIAYACGFDDPSYFCKVFKLFYGCSAENYRKRIKKTGRVKQFSSRK